MTTTRKKTPPTTTTTPTPELDYRAGRFNRKFTTVDDPYGIAITSEGVLLVTSINTAAIHFYDPTSGEPTNMDLELTPDDDMDALTSTNQFGSLGNGTNQFGTPYDLAVGEDGKIYVVDYGNSRVQIFEDDFEYSTNITGLNLVYSLSLHEGNLYVSASVAFVWRVRTFAEDDLEEGSGVIAVDSKNYGDVAVDVDDVHHVLNTLGDRLEAWTGSPATSFTATDHTYNLRPSGSEDDTDSNPWYVMVGPTTGRIYVSDIGREQVVVLSYDSSASTNHYTLVGVLGKEDHTSGSGDGEFKNPQGMLIHAGKLYVVDEGNNRIQVFDVPE